MTKDVHVSAYTKKDGTHVDAYDRARPGEGSSSEKNGQNLTLEGGVEMNEEVSPVYVLTNLKRNLWTSTSTACQNVENLLIQVEEARLSGVEGPELELNLKAFEAAHQMEKDAMDKILDAMTEDKNKKYYTSYLKIFNNYKELREESDYQLRLANYYYELKDYKEMKKALKDYLSVYDEQRKRISKLNKPYRYYKHEEPETQKELLNRGMVIANKMGKKETYELWQLSLNGVDENSEYIKKNGRVLKSVKDAPVSLQPIVKSKVKNQLHDEDSKGVYLHQNSSLAQKIVSNGGTKKYIKRNIDKIKKMKPGEVLQTGSGAYGYFTDLHLALGHFDIVDLHLDEDKNLRGYIIDTYDFNEDDNLWAVEWAYNVQEHGLLTNYFLIVEVTIPYEEWSRLSK